MACRADMIGVCDSSENRFKHMPRNTEPCSAFYATVFPFDELFGCNKDPEIFSNTPSDIDHESAKLTVIVSGGAGCAGGAR